MNYLISSYITRYFFHEKWYYYHYQWFLLSLSMILLGNGKYLICGMVFFICEHCIIFSLCLLKISLFGICFVCFTLAFFYLVYEFLLFDFYYFCCHVLVFLAFFPRSVFRGVGFDSFLPSTELCVLPSFLLFERANCWF
jgi:hypothetical protein